MYYFVYDLFPSTYFYDLIMQLHISVYSLLMPGIPGIVWIDHNLFIHSSINAQ